MSHHHQGQGQQDSVGHSDHDHHGHHDHHDHHDHHGHDHDGHHHHHDAASLNSAHWNDKASTYEDIPQAKEITTNIAQIMLQLYPFQKETTEVMDFACGTGLVARHIAGQAKSILGVDISQGMADVFNSRAAETGLTNLTAIVTNILEETNELVNRTFDVIVCSMALHHMASMPDTTRALAGFLKPGGVLLVADWLKPPSTHFHHHSPGVVHQGPVSHDLFKELFEGAGLKDVSFADPLEGKINDADVVILVAKGVKPT